MHLEACDTVEQAGLSVCIPVTFKYDITCEGEYVTNHSLNSGHAMLLGLQVYLITEMLTGGELLDAVLQRGSYNESEARMCFVQLLRGIEYLHGRCVCIHYDFLIRPVWATLYGFYGW